MLDPYKLLSVSKQPDHAPVSPGKIILLVLNERNGVKNLLVLNEDGTVLAAPLSIEDVADDVVALFADELVQITGEPSV